MPIKIGLTGIGWKYNLDKLSGKIHTMESPFADFLDDLINVDICPAGKKVYVKAGADNPNATCEYIINNYPPKATWSAVCLNIFDGYLGENLFNSFMELAKQDDMTVHKLWKDLKHIPNEKRIELRNIIKEKLPNADKILKKKGL